MSSKSHKDKIQHISKNYLSKISPIDIKKLTLPFSEFIKHATPQDIYNGKEKVPFNKHHPEYQAIFRNEFSDELRKFFKNIKKTS